MVIRRWSSAFVKLHWIDSKINRSYTSSNTYGINIAERGSTFKSRSHFHTGAIRSHFRPLPLANTLVYICPRTSRRLIYILLSVDLYVESFLRVSKVDSRPQGPLPFYVHPSLLSSFYLFLRYTLPSSLFFLIFSLCCSVLRFLKISS